MLAGTARAEVQIERTFLPNGASPSSFAVGLPGGVNFCFDPVRGAVSYVWIGGFLDITPARPGIGKFINPAQLLGSIVYRETGVAPLRRHDPTHVPVIEFTGYSLQHDAVEFRYTIGGLPVREEIRARADSTALIRRLHLNDETDARWWHVIEGSPATELKREPAGALVLELSLRKATP